MFMRKLRDLENKYIKFSILGNLNVYINLNFKNILYSIMPDISHFMNFIIEKNKVSDNLGGFFYCHFEQGREILSLHRKNRFLHSENQRWFSPVEMTIYGLICFSKTLKSGNLKTCHSRFFYCHFEWSKNLFLRKRRNLLAGIFFFWK
mgnify:CR=1 FL=1